MDGSQALRAVGAVPLSEAGLASAARGIPLHARGGMVRAYAMVDADDYEWLSCFRWYLRPDGYVVRNIRHPLDPKKQTQMQIARAIMGLGYGSPWKVDHRDHDPLNNCKSNLRVCTHQQNHENRRPEGDRGTTSAFRGVCWRRDREHTATPWSASGTVDGHQRHLGFYETEERAAEVAAAWRAEHMPFSTN